MLRTLPAAAVLALVPPAPALAETSKTFDVTAQIVAGCIVTTDGAGRWGSIDLGTVAGVAGTSAQATLVSSAGAGVAIECTPNLTASLNADNGDHPAGGKRYLQSAAAGTIGYQLYADGGTAPWTAALPLSFAGGGRRLIPIRAVATLAAPAAAGTYTDTVRVTLTW